MLKNIDISDDITIRESGSGSWYIFDRLSDVEIEISWHELNEVAKYSPLMKKLFDASKLALTELDRLGSDIGFEPDRYQERIRALDGLSRAVRDVEKENA